MKLITSNEILHRYIPNAISTVSGERSMFDRIYPWLASAEVWLTENITGEDTLDEIAMLDDDDTVKSLASLVVVGHALVNAIPALDLVLTPNGFGVVSNQNIAPASKERVERLIATTRKALDNNIESLLARLKTIETWRISTQCEFFCATLFPNLDVVSLIGCADELRWEKYIELRAKIFDIEASLAEEYISPELMAELRANFIADTPDKFYSHVVARLRAQIIDVIQGRPIKQSKMLDIVNFIRINPDEFPAWVESDTAKLFSPPVFSNDKTSAGYFF